MGIVPFLSTVNRDIGRCALACKPEYIITIRDILTHTQSDSTSLLILMCVSVKVYAAGSRAIETSVCTDRMKNLESTRSVVTMYLFSTVLAMLLSVRRSIAHRLCTLVLMLWYTVIQCSV